MRYQAMDLKRALWVTFLLVALTMSSSSASERPVIGILTQELSHYLASFYNATIYPSYIAASYVKYFESSGARVSPIPIGRSLDYYRELTNRLNGVVFPGGGIPISIDSEYKKAGNLLLTALKEAAEQGRPVPALGICLGMELMVLHDYKNTTSDPGDSPLVPCDCRAMNAPLNLSQTALTSALFRRATSYDLEVLQTRPVTANEHRWCVTPTSYVRSGLSETWRVLSTSLTPQRTEFISAMESTYLPFYAVIFHPEKNAFEWKSTKTYAHDVDAVAAMRVFGDSFVATCRENNNSFPLPDERTALIYPHEPADSGAHGIAYEQIYLFKENILL